MCAPAQPATHSQMHVSPHMRITQSWPTGSVVRVRAGRLEITTQIRVDHGSLTTHSYLMAGDVWRCSSHDSCTLSSADGCAAELWGPDQSLHEALAWSWDRFLHRASALGLTLLRSLRQARLLKPAA